MAFIANASALLGGLQAHSVSSPFPYIVVARGRNGLLEWGVQHPDGSEEVCLDLPAAQARADYLHRQHVEKEKARARDAAKRIFDYKLAQAYKAITEAQAEYNDALREILG